MMVQCMEPDLHSKHSGTGLCITRMKSQCIETQSYPEYASFFISLIFVATEFLFFIFCILYTQWSMCFSSRSLPVILFQTGERLASGGQAVQCVPFHFFSQLDLLRQAFLCFFSLSAGFIACPWDGSSGSECLFFIASAPRLYCLHQHMVDGIFLLLKKSLGENCATNLADSCCI